MSFISYKPFILLDTFSCLIFKIKGTLIFSTSRIKYFLTKWTSIYVKKQIVSEKYNHILLQRFSGMKSKTESTCEQNTIHSAFFHHYINANVLLKQNIFMNTMANAISRLNSSILLDHLEHVNILLSSQDKIQFRLPLSPSALQAVMPETQ